MLNIANRARFEDERQRGAILAAGEVGLETCANVGLLLRQAGIYEESKGVTQLEVSRS